MLQLLFLFVFFDGFYLAKTEKRDIFAENKTMHSYFIKAL